LRRDLRQLLSASQGQLVQSLGVAFPTEATPGEAEFETKVPGEGSGG
jgi:hypothetical protein